jgi:hypothetical protein
MSLTTNIMANYCDTGAEWINIDSDDSEYDSGPELIQPLSPVLAANDAGFEWLGPEDNIDPLAIEYTNTVEFLDTVIQDISRLFVIPKPYHCIGARIQAVTMHMLGVPIPTIIALTHISQSQV